MAVVLLIQCPDGSLVDAPMFGSLVVIGRSSKADIKIDDPLMSSQHCSIELKNNLLVFKDLGSTNGSFLYNSKIQSVAIKIGDQIRVGNSIIYIDESKLNPKEKTIFANSSGKTQLQYIDIAKMQNDEDMSEGFSPKHSAAVSVDALEKMLAHKRREQNKLSESEKASNAKKRPSVGAALAKKVIKDKKSISSIIFNKKQKNFEQEDSGNTKFLKLEKNRKDDNGPLPKRHQMKKDVEKEQESDIQDPKDNNSSSIMGIIKKLLGR